MFSYEICEVFKNTYFEGHLQMTASEFIGDTTLFHETILKKDTNEKKKKKFKMEKSITEAAF